MRVRTNSILLMIAAMLSFFFGAVQAQSAQADKNAKPPAQGAVSGDYVGSETCIGCHEDSRGDSRIR